MAMEIIPVTAGILIAPPEIVTRVTTVRETIEPIFAAGTEPRLHATM